MKCRGWIWLGLLGTAAAGQDAAVTPPPESRPTVIFVAGAPGEALYASNLVRQATLWSNVCAEAGAAFVTVGFAPGQAAADRTVLADTLAAQPRQGAAPLWLVLAGHGTFDGREARFNLRGPDVTPAELAAWLAPFERPLLILNTASASAPFLPALTGSNRVVVTATRSGHEVNYARFGDYLAAVWTDPEADLDHDGQISLLEAVLTAAGRVAEFYRTEGRLATEHALIEDNGDGRGTPAEWFRGVQPVKAAADGTPVDGRRAHQVHLRPSAAERALPPEVRARRDELEREIFRLRERRDRLPEAEYLNQLERLLLELADLLLGEPGT